MIKRWLILLYLVLLIPCFAFSQVNYVLNPSFEIDTICPRSSGDMTVKYWTGGDTIFASDLCTPTYCNVCATGATGVNIPFGGGGGCWYYQYPRTGKGMTLTCLYTDSFVTFAPLLRTYLQGHLYQHLITGKNYCVRFYVSLAIGSCYAVNHIGAYLDNGSIDTALLSKGGCNLIDRYYPQIEEDSIVADTAGYGLSASSTIYQVPYDSSIFDHRWVKIQGSFIANGTESFITIGSFDPTDSIEYVRLQAGDGYAGYLIDDVSVVESDAVADAGPDTVYIAAAGDSVWIGNDTAAVGGGAGMPCWWYTAAAGTGSPAIDSGGRIMVHPDTTTTYIMMMDLCGNQTYDTITVKIGPNSVPMYHLMHLDVFPDPLTSLTPALSINGEGAAGFIYKITNVLGKTITAGLLTGNTNTLYLPQLLPGIYILDITDPESGARLVKQLIVE